MKIKIAKVNEDLNCGEGHVKFTNEFGEGPDCEHCGTLPPFSAAVSDGGTWWCISCNACDDDNALTEEQTQQVEAEALKREKAYIKKRYKQLFPQK